MNTEEKRPGGQKITQWVRGSSYALAVEVQVVFPADEPSEPCLRPETVRFLEHLTEEARAGNVEALTQVGTVYVKLNPPAEE